MGIKLLKNILRLIIAIPLSLLGLKYLKWSSFWNIILFLCVYLAISILIELLIPNKKNK